MRYKAQIKFVERMLLIHFIGEKPNLRGERFKLFVDKLEKILNVSLEGIKIVLSPYPLKQGEEIEFHWSRFDQNVWRLKDIIEK